MTNKQAKEFFEKVRGKRIRKKDWGKEKYFIPDTLRISTYGSMSMIGYFYVDDQKGNVHFVKNHYCIYSGEYCYTHYWEIIEDQVIDNSWEIKKCINYSTEDKLDENEFNDDQVYQKLNIFLKISVIKKLKKTGNINEVIENIVEEYLEE